MWKISLLLVAFSTVFSLPLQIGQDAPHFELRDQEGFRHDLITHRGRYVLLFFYPRDYTIQAQKKLRAMEKLLTHSLGDKLIVYGISRDGEKRHRKFYDKMHISFDLLSDEDGKVIKAYNAKGLIETKPVVVLIGPDGRIFRTYENMQKFLASKDLVLSIINGSI